MVSTKATWWHLYICLFNTSNGHMIPVVLEDGMWSHSYFNINFMFLLERFGQSKWECRQKDPKHCVVADRLKPPQLNFLWKSSIQELEKVLADCKVSQRFWFCWVQQLLCPIQKCRAHLSTEPWFELRPAGQQALTKGTLAPGPAWIALSPGTSLRWATLLGVTCPMCCG